MVTINWLVQNSGFKNIICLAGKQNVQNEISGVHIMDNPDTVRFFKNGEMVLTTGFSLKDMPIEKRKELIVALKNKNCSGIALKINRYFNEVPAEILEMAEKVGLPVVQIPYEYSLADIEYRIMHQNFVLSNDGLAFANDLYTEITKCLLMGNALNEICNTIQRVTDFTVIFLDEVGMVVATAENDYHIGQGSKLFQVSEMKIIQNQFDQGSYVVLQNKIFGTNSLFFRMWDLKTNDSLLGYFCFISKNEEDIMMHIVKAIEYILPLLRIEMFRFKTTNVSTIRARNELLEQVLIKHDSSELSTLIHCCELFGFRTDLAYLCVVWQEQGENLDMGIKNIMQNSLGKRQDEFFIGRIGENTVCILGEKRGIDEPVHIQRGEQLITEVDQLSVDGSKSSCGIGISVKGIEKIWKSYENALLSLKVNKIVQDTFESGKKHFWSELIFAHYEELEIEKIYRKTFYKLRRWDDEKNGNLVETLIAYLKNDFSVKETAEKLYIHRNTLNQRLQKIQEIIGEIKGEARIQVMFGLIAMQIVDSKQWANERRK